MTVSSLEETVTFNLELNVEKAFDSSRRIELILFRVLGLWSRICRMLGVPEDAPVVQLIERVQRLVMVIRQAHTAIVLLETASGPIGWAMFALGAGGAALATIDTAQQWGSMQA